MFRRRRSIIERRQFVFKRSNERSRISNGKHQCIAFLACFAAVFVIAGTALFEYALGD